MVPIESNIIVIPGARKSGTTTLYNLLLQHDKIQGFISHNGSNLKEPIFFALQPSIVKNNIEWYKSLFKKEGARYYVDASQHYFVSPYTKSLLNEYALKVKFIIILRDPVQRLFSDYLHQKAKVKPSERRSFTEIIDYIHENQDREIEAVEEESIRQAEQRGTIDLDAGTHLLDRLPFRAQLQDPLVTHRYLQNSMYSKHVTRFERSRHEVLIVGLEELLADPSRVIDRIFDFLELVPEEISLPHHNKTELPSAVGRLYLHATQLIRSIGPIETLLDSALFESDWIKSVKQLIRPQQKDREEVEYQVPADTFQNAYEILQGEYHYFKNNHHSIYKKWHFTPKIN